MIAEAIRRARIARLKKRYERLEADAAFWRDEQRRLAGAAYAINDMMAEPMRWGRLQNDANWASYRAHKYALRAQACHRLIARLQSSVEAA